jgi:hypothetical protein
MRTSEALDILRRDMTALELADGVLQGALSAEVVDAIDTLIAPPTIPEWARGIVLQPVDYVQITIRLADGKVLECTARPDDPKSTASLDLGHKTSDHPGPTHLVRRPTGQVDLTLDLRRFRLGA